MLRPCLIALGALVLTGCGSVRDLHDAPGRAPLQHVVLFDLRDPADTTELTGDMVALLGIPGVVTIVTGPPVDIGRASVTRDYDLGLVVGLQSVAAYRTFLEHPVHAALVEKWKPRWNSVRIIDFGVPCDAGSGG